jgi:hypothetical protein
MTVDELAAHFSTYMEQIPRLKSADAYWALLHYIVIFPDICGALESTDARATGERCVHRLMLSTQSIPSCPPIPVEVVH